MPKGFSSSDETPQQPPDVSSRSTAFLDPTCGLRPDALSACASSDADYMSPIVEASSADCNRGAEASNMRQFTTALSTKLAAHVDAADRQHCSRPPSPPVIEESLMNGTLMSGQPDIAHSMLSACNDLPPFPDALAILHQPKYMPTDPSPFALPIASQKSVDVVEDTLRLGGLVKLVVDGQQFTGRVMEIHPADDASGPPAENKYRGPTSSMPHFLHPASKKAWCADELVSPVLNWINTLSAPYFGDDVTRGQEGHIAAATNLAVCPPGDARSNEPALHPNDLGQSPRTTALPEAPGSNHDSRVDVVTLLMGVQGKVDQNRDCAQDEPICVPFKVPQWKYTKIDSNKTYQCGGVLGKGSFGKVYLVLRTRDKRQFAMKIHDFRYRTDILVAKALVKELAVQHLITGRPFLLGMTDVWYSSAKFLHVVMEHCPGGNLLSRVRKLTDKQMLLVIAEIILGLLSLHENGIIHQDIKPDNILIDGEGHCVITDFGLSTVADTRKGLSMSRQKAPGGTPEYTAPEISLENDDGKHPPNLKMAYWDHSADYWSLGATIFHLQTGELITRFSEQGWKAKLDSPAVRQSMVNCHSPSSLIILVEKFTRFDRTSRWKGSRVKEADYFKPLNASATGWYEVYAKKYAPFRYSYANAVDSDTASTIKSYNDTRAKFVQSADMKDLIEALRSQRISVRKDDCLMPERDFKPRIYPDDSKKR